MKLKVPAIPTTIAEEDQNSILNYVDSLERHAIGNQPWVKYKSDVVANFSIAHHHHNLILKFDVQEKYLMAKVRKINGGMHKDNCVEFFISFNDEKEYYNFEFNCLGSAKVGYGESKKDRNMFGEDLIKKIKINASLNIFKTEETPSFVWQMVVIIPKSLFRFSEIASYHDLKCRANFYKCGDNLPEPHFLSWNMIETEFPDFHQSRFFGELIFE